jgi:hypothetical protein
MKVLYDPRYVSDETISDLAAVVSSFREMADGLSFILEVFREDPGYQKLTDTTFSYGVETLSSYWENFGEHHGRLGDVVEELKAAKKWMEPSAYAGESRPQQPPDDKAVEAEVSNG